MKLKAFHNKLEQEWYRIIKFPLGGCLYPDEIGKDIKIDWLQAQLYKVRKELDDPILMQYQIKRKQLDGREFLLIVKKDQD